MRTRWADRSGAPQLHVGLFFVSLGGALLVRGLFRGLDEVRFVTETVAFVLGVVLVVDGLPRAWRRQRSAVVAGALNRGEAVTSPDKAVLDKVLRRLVAGAAVIGVFTLAVFLLHLGTLLPAVYVWMLPASLYLTMGDRDSRLNPSPATPRTGQARP
jgi:hypothetical protein